MTPGKTFVMLLILFLMYRAAFAQNARITVNNDKIENKLTKLIYGSNIEDVNH